MLQQMLSEKEAAAYIGMSIHYLRRDRHEGAVGNRTPGPTFYKIGARVLYRIDDLERWLQEHRVDRAVAR